MKRMQSCVTGSLMLMITMVLPAAPSKVSFEKGEEIITVLIDGKPFSTYFFGRDLPRPFFHPLRAADGTVVTRGFPMLKDIAGESKDHPHHRANWFTHGDVNGVDFWSESGKRLGRIVHKSIDKMQGGMSQGVLETTSDWIDDTGKKILIEKQQVVIHGDATRRYMDYAITLTPTDGEVKFGDTKEGSFAIRLATPLEEKSGGVMTNARGAVGEKNCWGKKAEWVDDSGSVAGNKLGVTLMDHPTSFRHPTTWHVRGYGLFAINPFGLRDFTGDKTQDGSYVLKAGNSLALKYRVLIHTGDVLSAKIGDEYSQYIKETK